MKPKFFAGIAIVLLLSGCPRGFNDPLPSFGDIDVSNNTVYEGVDEDWLGVSSYAYFEYYEPLVIDAPPMDQCWVFTNSWNWKKEKYLEGERLDVGDFGEYEVSSERGMLEPAYGGDYEQSPFIVPGIESGAMYTISFPGGEDLPAFTASIEVMGSPEFTSPQVVLGTDRNEVIIDFDDDLELVWDASSPGDHISFYIIVKDLSFEEPYRECRCILTDDGRFTVPAAILAELNYVPGEDIQYSLESTRSRIEEIVITAHDGTAGEIYISSEANTKAYGPTE